MRGKHLWALVAVSTLVLLAAIYLGVHPPSPPANSPGASAVAEPAATTETPAQASASEPAPVVTDQANGSGSSFRELRQCVYASRDLIGAKHLMDCRFYEGKPEYQEALAKCLDGPMNARNRITAAERALSQCDQADMGQRYFDATKQAAKNGDVDAQLCYLQGDFFSPEGAQIFTAAELEEYKKVAPGYVDAGLKRGDWRIVHLLNTRHFHPGGGPVRLLAGIGDRETRYKMTKLLRLGASGSYGKFLASQLEGMMHPDLNPSAALSPEVAREGDAWAQQTYTDYFAGVPGLIEAPVICAPAPGQPGSLPDLTNPDVR
jgi:hypothetical protein